MQTDLLRIRTRGSALALAQAEETRARLMAAHGLPQEAFEIVVISTSGDRIQDRPLSEAGGKGLFTKEIEEALLSGAIDIAVHSSKDMPTVLPEGLELSCFLEREDVRDAYIGRAASRLLDLPHNAVIGSSSLRRQALIRRLRPDIDVVLYRGNVQTRLRKLGEGVVDATLLANAGLKRLGLGHVVTELLPVETFPPAPGQGAICIESRIGDRAVIGNWAKIGEGKSQTGGEIDGAGGVEDDLWGGPVQHHQAALSQAGADVDGALVAGTAVGDQRIVDGADEGAVDQDVDVWQDAFDPGAGGMGRVVQLLPSIARVNHQVDGVSAAVPSALTVNPQPVDQLAQSGGLLEGFAAGDGDSR